MNHIYRPRIAILGRFAESTSVTSSDAIVTTRAVVDAVWNAGGDPFTLLPVRSVNWGERLGGFEGILLPGGNGVTPDRYSRETGAAESDHDRLLQDTADSESADYALESGMAVLAISGGLHVVNLARGGTLVSGTHTAQSDLVYEVTFQRDFERFGFASSTVPVSGSHHQTLGRAGQGIDVVASSQDGVPEAVTIEAAGWAVGVQWHPEDSAAHDPQQAALFSEFVRQARMARQTA